MIEKLIVTDFQCHKKLEVNFGQGVTTITGRNDVGKSALLRALRWAMLNKPTGSNFIRHGRKLSKVSIDADHRRITRQGGTRSKLYQIDDKKFTAFRSDVPPEISKLLAVDEINFQRQHESVFWFDLTPGQVAKELNKLVDLETIDKAQASISKRLRSAKAELAVAEKRLFEARDKVRSLRWVKRLDGKLGKIEKTHAQYAAKSLRMDSAAFLIGQAVRTDARLRAATAATTAATAATLAGRASLRAGKRADSLRDVIRAATAASGTIAGPLPSITPTENAGERSRLIRKDVQRLMYLLTLADNQLECLCHLKEKLTQKQSDLEKKLKGRCPMCGGILTNQNTSVLLLS